MSFTNTPISSSNGTNAGIWLLNGVQGGVGSWNGIGRYIWNKSVELDHGTTWNARLELARKAAGRKVITIHFNTRKEMAWGAIQDINRRYGF